jgi:hypothetical protein
MRSLFLSIPDMAEGEKVDRYVSGLLPHIRKEVLMQDPATLEEAVRTASKHDALRRTFGVYELDHSVEDRFEDSVGNGNDPMELGAMMIDFQCWNCGKSGHKARDCSEPRKESKGRPAEAP